MKTLRHIQNFVRRLKGLRQGLLCQASIHPSPSTLLLFSLLLLVSCKRMPLYDMDNEVNLELKLNLELNLDIDVDIETNLDIEVEDSIKLPEYNKVLFYSPDDSHQQYSTFVGTTGGSISTPPSHYSMLVYSFGTEYIQIRGEESLSTIEAFTSDITATKSRALRGFTRTDEEEPQGPIIYAPDHLLVAREDIFIPEFTGESQTITIRAVSSTIVETYSFEVSTVVGTEYIKSCEAFVTNQSCSNFFGRGEKGERSTQPATIYFPVGVNRKKGCLYTVFNTFGKLPGASKSYLYILITDTGGTEHHISVDITDQFEKEDHHILIEEEVDVPQPEGGGGGGIAPTVDPWADENHDVPIG